VLQLVPQAAAESEQEKNIRLRDRRFKLARLLRYTDEILQCAQKGDWGSVEEMEHVRKMEIMDCFRNEGIDDSPLIAEALATLIHLNKKISELVQNEKQELLRKQNSMQQNKRAALDYQHNSRSPRSA